jgi:hypothetical protein
MPATVNDLGEFLRRERELRHIDLDEVAEATKISRRYLEAIEEDQYDRLPGEAFVRGFIRSYVKYIGLDPAETMLMYEQARFTQDSIPARMVRMPPARLASKPRLLLWLLGAALVVVGGILVSLATFLETPRAFRSTLLPGREQSPPLTTTAPLILTAIADSDTWLRISIDGKEEDDILLRAGQATKWKGNERFVLSIGNVRGTRLTLNAREITIPLPPQNVLRSYTLSRDMLP